MRTMTPAEMRGGLLSDVDPEKVAAMRAKFHADRDRNHPRRVAVAMVAKLLCTPFTWLRIYGETFADSIRLHGDRGE